MIIFVSNKNLCKDDFLRRVEKLCASKPDIFILREKDLSDDDFFILAKDIKDICTKFETKLYINSKINIARKLNIKNIQISFDDFFKYKDELEDFINITVSIHSKEEAKVLEEERVDFLIFGHIFETSCKVGLKPRGIGYLKEICENSSKKILAIGGINESNFKDVLKSGAFGFCIMSETMLCENPKNLIKKYKE